MGNAGISGLVDGEGAAATDETKPSGQDLFVMSVKHASYSVKY